MGDAVGRHALLAGASLLVLVPIVAMIIAAFKSVPGFFARPYGLTVGAVRG